MNSFVSVGLQVETAMDIALRDGTPANRLATDLKQYLKHPDKLFRRVRDEHGQLQLSKRTKEFHPGAGVYRSSYKNARRLAVTERASTPRSSSSSAGTPTAGATPCRSWRT